MKVSPPEQPVSKTSHGSITTDDPQIFWSALIGSLIGLMLATAGFGIGIGVVGLVGETKSFWYLNRASGFVAYLLLWGSVVWGLLLSSRLLKGVAKPAVLLDVHQFLSNVGLGFALFHGLILMGDRYLSFPLQAVLLPFAGSYEPLLTAAGQIAMWLSVLLIVSFYVRRFIGQRTWRLLHYTSFIAYLAALTHSVMIGSESNQIWVQFLYLLTGSSILFLVYFRILSGSGRPAKKVPARAQRVEKQPMHSVTAGSKLSTDTGTPVRPS